MEKCFVLLYEDLLRGNRSYVGQIYEMALFCPKSTPMQSYVASYLFYGPQDI